MAKNRKQFEENVKKALRGGFIAGHQFPTLLK
jgi:hypothetical protein